MIIDHTHPIYKKRRNGAGNNKYNGAYYYSLDIIRHIIPKVKTDRNWVTINMPELASTDVNLDHSIIFIHNNLQPNAYQWLRKYKDLILVCGVPSTTEKIKFFGTPVYLPLSVNVKQIEKYRIKIKDKTVAFAGRRNKLNNHVPSYCDDLTDMPRYRLLQEMSRYYEIYAVGRTAIEAKILGCKIKVYDERFPDPNFWKVIDCKESAKTLQQLINNIDGDQIWAEQKPVA